MAEPTLAQLVADLPDGLLRPVDPRATLDLPVSAPVLYEPGSAVVVPGAVVLGVGVDAESAAAADLVRAAAASGAAAVVVKLAGTPPADLLAAGAAAGVTVLHVAPDTDWARLCGLLGAALAGRAASGPLGSLADAVAAITGGQVVVEDATGRVVAASGRPAGPGGSRVVAGVHTDDGYAGSIAVTVPVLGPQTAQTLEEAARIAARHLSVGTPTRSLETLLAGRGDPRGLDVPADATGFAVVAFEVDGDGARLAAIVTRAWEAFRGRVWCAVSGGTVHALVPVGAGGAARVVEMARRVTREAEPALGVPVRAGVGPVVATLPEVALSRGVADQVLRVLAGREPGRDLVATLDGVRSEVVLLALRDAAAGRPDLALGAVVRLAGHDAKHGTPYVETLRAYLDAFGDVGSAAAAICVHTKTFRYRLRRIAEISGIQLADPEERLAVHLHLRLQDA